jgi:serine O-acetyltransferase
MTLTDDLHETIDRSTIDGVWDELYAEAQMQETSPSLRSLMHLRVTSRSSFEDSLATGMAQAASDGHTYEQPLRDMFFDVLTQNPEIGRAARIDLVASVERNPAYPNILIPYLFAKGFLGLEMHRVAHALWHQGRSTEAFLIQSRISEVLAMDIHPAARIGTGVFIDHATGIVIGETAVVDSDVSLLQGVTLGGTGKESGDRHPKVRRGCLISAGAIILGNVTIGEYSRVGAGSVVLSDVPPHATVVGVPAKVVRINRSSDCPSETMDPRIEDMMPEYVI